MGINLAADITLQREQQTQKYKVTKNTCINNILKTAWLKICFIHNQHTDENCVTK